VFEVIYPFCHEPLAESLLTSRAQSIRFKEFHKLVFKNLFRNIFTTRSVRNVCPIQDEGQIFSKYFSQIKEAAAVMLLPVLEIFIAESNIGGSLPGQGKRTVSTTKFDRS